MILNMIIMEVLMILFIVLSIAFVTLFERHLLGLSQNRLGPNKVFFMGVVQAALDGVKLMSKEQILPMYSSDLYFLFVPGMTFIFMFFEWLSLPFFFYFLNFQFSFLFLMSLIGFSVYFTIISGLLSNSKYSFIGSIRSSSQSVSFEIGFSIMILIFMFFLNILNLKNLFNFSLFFLFYFFILMVLAELNRAPFDFAEGESELVSGFNTEYSSVAFIFLFLGEYGVLIFFSVLLSVMFFNFSFIFVFIFLTLMLLIRSAYPRYRYDKLMNFFWKFVLPLIIMFFYIFFFITF